MVNKIILFSGLLLLASERHLYTLHHRLYRRKSSYKITLTVICITWVISVVISLPPLFGYGTYIYDSRISECVLNHRLFLDNDTLVYILMKGFMLGAIMMLYIRIFIYLRKHRRMFPGEGLRPLQSHNWSFNNVPPHFIGQNIPRAVTYPAGFDVPQQPIVIANQFIPNNSERLKCTHLIYVFVSLTVSYVLLNLPYISVTIWLTISETVSFRMIKLSAWIRHLHLIVDPVMVIPWIVRSH